MPPDLASTIFPKRDRMEPELKRISLSEREIEMLTWAARGKTSAAIAEIVGLTKRTIDFHIDNARIKLGAKTRTEAAIKAVSGRLVKL